MCDNRLFHDFPRLAKESGFYFNYRSKRVDWSEIDKIDLEDIAKNKRFERLEDKLELVINCELDDDVTKVLDCNFVKLFRLAQLSVSYLRHCQFYLDRCVILLQEQLTAALKEAENIRNTVIIQNPFKCLECEKTFLSASYLESHKRRRHIIPTPSTQSVSIAVQTDEEVKQVISTQNTQQQTENIKTVSSECQTTVIRTSDIGLMTNLENQRPETNDIMEMFESLCQRIAVIEKHASYQKQVDEKQPSCSELVTLLQNLVPAFQQHTSPLSANPGSLKVLTDAESQDPDKQQPLINFQNEPEPIVVLAKEEIIKEASLDIFSDKIPTSQEMAPQRLLQDSSSNLFTSRPLSTAPLARVRKKVNISINENMSVPIPRPRPRKSTISRQQSLLIDFDDTDSDDQKSSRPVFKPINMEERDKSIGQLELNKEILEEVDNSIEISTPVITISSEPNIEETNHDTMTTNIKKDTQNIIKNNEFKPRPKSLFKTIVKKSSPKFKGLRKSIKKSWSNFSDSKIFNADNMLMRPSILNKNQKLEEERDEESSCDEMTLPEKDGKQKKKEYQNKQRELGVDPEWLGIPENSFTRIKAILEQRRQILEKKNPDYLQKRNRLELLITQRIKKSSKTDDIGIDKTKPTLAPEQAKMYDIESETESEANSPFLIEKTRHIMDSSFNREKSPPSNFLNSAQTHNEKINTIVEVQNGIAGSDSSDNSEIEKEKPAFMLKSSLSSKGKDEIKKKVVFADNFEIETTHDLMKTPNSSNSSTSSSDWDIPMP